ncbi:hypothetical protein D3C84_703860 [compost metagenome]
MAILMATSENGIWTRPINLMCQLQTTSGKWHGTNGRHRTEDMALITGMAMALTMYTINPCIGIRMPQEIISNM